MINRVNELGKRQNQPIVDENFIFSWDESTTDTETSETASNKLTETGDTVEKETNRDLTESLVIGNLPITITENNNIENNQNDVQPGHTTSHP